MSQLDLVSINYGQQKEVIPKSSCADILAPKCRLNYFYTVLSISLFLLFHQNSYNFLNLLICRTPCISNVFICVHVIKLPNNSTSKNNQTPRGYESCNHRTRENAHSRDSMDFSSVPQQDQIYLAIESPSDRDITHFERNSTLSQAKH